MPETMTTGLRRAGYVTVAKVANQLRGLSNSEIVSEFFVSEATVKSHVGNILAKLAVRDRVQAVILAFEAGLVEH